VLEVMKRRMAEALAPKRTHGGLDEARDGCGMDSKAQRGLRSFWRAYVGLVDQKRARWEGKEL